MPLALVYMLVLGAIWGGETSVSKLALERYSATTVMLWQAAVAFLFLLAVAAWRRRLPPLGRQHLTYYAIMGVMELAVPGYAIVLALQHIPAGLMSAIVATSPVFTYLSAMVAGQERFQPVRALGIAIGFAGVLVILVPEQSLPEPDMVGWALVALVAPIGYSINAVYAYRYMPKDADSVGQGCGLAAVAMCVVLAIEMASGGPTLPWPPEWPETPALLSLGLASGTAFILYFAIIRMAGAVYMSLVGYVIVAVGVITGMIVFGEQHSLWVWAGIGLMVLGVGFVNAGQKSADVKRSSRTYEETTR